MSDEPLAHFTPRTYTLGDEVAAHIEKLIRSGTLSPGDRLPSERDLSERFGISRASVRQGLHELAQKHLIIRRHGARSLVADIPKGAELLHDRLAVDDPELSNASELREIVEPRIAGLAAARATQADLIQLKEVLDRSNESLEPEESLRLDEQFHHLLACAAQNPLLITLCNVSNDWVRPIRRDSHVSKSGRRISIRGHMEIYEAVSRHDPEVATLVMDRHLREVTSIIDDHRPPADP